MTLIVNADDFGRSPEINRAIIRAHRQGVLTSASLMMAGDAADEAVELARQNPTLAVGLHVVAVDGPAVLPPDRIPRLVNASGCFPDAPIRLGLRYAFNRAARRELAAEITAQFDRFAATGLTLSHVNSHQHMHMHPVVFDLVHERARHFGARGIRVVRDDLPLSWQYERAGAFAKVIATAVFALLAVRCRRGCRRSGLAMPQRTFGFLHSGRMSEAYVLFVLRHLPKVDAEIYFHPTEGQRVAELGPNPAELAALLSTEVRRAIDARDLQLGRYNDMSAGDIRSETWRRRQTPVPSATRWLASK